MSLERFDIIVVGGGHAGCEAAASAARMGLSTLLVTMNLDTIAQMSCNPAIGGLAKGQIVREVDALGGLMGLVTDETAIQFRMLNSGKGPAVRGPRAQCDRREYSLAMRRRLERIENLTLRQDQIASLEAKGNLVKRVRTTTGIEYEAGAVILTTGTFLNGLIHMGASRFPGGRLGEPSCRGLTESLKNLGFEIGRLKTGTPPRAKGRSVDYSLCTRQPGDADPKPFSFRNESVAYEQIPCFITWTNDLTHEIIRKNLHRAPLYTGQITSTGPRYCPSIEVKVVRFPDRSSHQIFIEPEGRKTDEVYLNGLATSIPQDVQLEMLRSIRGLERVEITRFGYAIEYDFVPPHQITPALSTRSFPNLFFAGQINGTSGYEEAAGQGILAGINAGRFLQGKPPVILSRDVAYIGVMVDDLVTKSTDEPYRMFTSRAEFRLLLRQDNADLRLMPIGRECGLIDDATWKRFCRKRQQIAELEDYLAKKRHGDRTLAEILRRPDVTFSDLLELDSTLLGRKYPKDVVEQVEIGAKYAGYIARELERVRNFRKYASKAIPPDFDFSSLREIKFEAREKLSRFRPRNLAQAMRLQGVTPADIQVLMIHLARRKQLA